MSRVLMGLWILLCVLVVAAGYVRLAPTDPAKWHVPLTFEGDRDLSRGAQRVVTADPGEFTKLGDLIAATPRTKVIAGTLEEGRVTYEARTPVMAFPDYVTIEQTDTGFKIFSRSRFGRKDLGVNAARVTEWLNALKAG